MSTALLFARVVLSAAFAVAAVAKLAGLGRFRAALESLGVPAAWRPALAVAVPLAELAVAVALVPDASAGVAGLAALVMLLAFSAVISRARARGREADCHCFGPLGSERLGRAALARNGVLAVLAALVAIAG